MLRNLELHFSRPNLVRILADACLLNLGLAGGFAVRFFILLIRDTPVLSTAEIRDALGESLAMYTQGAPVLTITGLAVFILANFYTRMRFYAVRRKLSLLVGLVALVYLIFLAATIYLPMFSWQPRAMLVGSWAVTEFLFITSRFWSALWRHMAAEDQTSSAARLPTQHTVLVIGGAGYIGSVLCRFLLEQGYRVRVLDALLYGDIAIRALLSDSRFTFLRGDSRDVAALVRAMKGVHSVVHLGEIVGDPACALDEHLTLEVNLVATRTIGLVAKGYGVRRLVYASSCSVYGALLSLVDEESEQNPVSLYARVKVAAERALLELKSTEFSPVVLRLATVYGISPRPRFDLAVNALAAEAATAGQITIFGGSQWRPFVHVRDVARAIMLCLAKPESLVGGQTFNVGSDDQNLTINQLGDLIRDCLPGTEIKQAAEAMDPRSYHVSFAKIRDQLGFEPQEQIPKAIDEIAAVLRQGIVADHRDPRYSNVEYLSRLRADEAPGEFRPTAAAVDSRALLGGLVPTGEGA